MSDTRLESYDAVGPSFWDNYVALDVVAKDPYGRRSRAWRHKASNKLTTETELNEATETYKPLLNFFRRQDKLTCFMISMFGGGRDGLRSKFLGILLLPFIMTYLGYSMVLMAWDRWIMGPPTSE